MKQMLKRLKSISIPNWLFIAALAGLAFGLLLPEFTGNFKFINDIFLRLIKAIIAPILFSVLIRALGNAENAKELGKLGWKSLLCFEIWSTLALLIGWFTALVFNSGAGINLEGQHTVNQTSMTLNDILVNAFPTSIIDSMARGDILQIVVFSFIFGIAALSVGEKAKPVLQFTDSLAEIAFKFTHYIFYLAPPAVFAAMAITASNGKETLTGLASFIISAWFAQFFFLVVILFGTLALFKVPLKGFIYAIKEPFLIAFATTSSAAALPQTLTNLEKYGIPKKLIGIVAPLSLSLNLNGSTIYLGMATLFVAQAANIHLSMDQQILILLVLKVTSKGVAGIPRANFVVLAAIFPTFGLPTEALGLLLGIDVLIDPVRTSVNVISHCAAPTVIAKW
ncbi:MAG: dicarboxylate/amino acid:cation symporter [Bacteroidetes bacterium]|nr:dicarboxylate/amino acid:cation symporter [Bacteroidota bacterium]